MAPPATRIMDVCVDLLTAVQARHGGVLPTRQYVSAGAPAWDCELLAVWCERTAGFDGDVMLETSSPIMASAAHVMRYGTFVVTIVRCTPAVPESSGGKVVVPTVAKEEEAASTLYEDAQRVINALVLAEKAGELPGCNGMAFVDWTVQGPEGGLVAGNLRVRVGLATGL
jgi:hypothetical protein